MKETIKFGNAEYEVEHEMENGVSVCVYATIDGVEHSFRDVSDVTNYLQLRQERAELFQKAIDSGVQLFRYGSPITTLDQFLEDSGYISLVYFPSKAGYKPFKEAYEMATDLDSHFGSDNFYDALIRQDYPRFPFAVADYYDNCDEYQTIQPEVLSQLKALK